jgi:hypothetical protein
MFYKATLNPYIQETIRTTIRSDDGKNINLEIKKTSKLDNFIVNDENKAILEKIEVRLDKSMLEIVKDAGFNTKLIKIPKSKCRQCGSSDNIVLIAKVFKFTEI